MLCTEYSLVNHSAEVITAQPLYCNCWTCEICQPRRAKKLMRQAHAGNPDMFITLTANPAYLATKHERARALADAWRVIVKRIKRKYGYDKLPYFCVFEATKRGEPHLHILLRCKWIDQEWLSDAMSELTQSPIVWIERIKNKAKMAAYVAKYVGKNPHRFEGVKRYWTTQNWEVPHEEDDEPDHLAGGVWEIWKHTLGAITYSLARQGYRIEEQAGKTCFYPPPEKDGMPAAFSVW